jgi:hypothetical protein
VSISSLTRALLPLLLAGAICAPPAAAQPDAAEPAALNSGPCRTGADAGPLYPKLQGAIREVMGYGIVAEGKVAYRRLAESRAWLAYQGLAGCLRKFDPAGLASREQELAFWINLYNAIVLHGVIESGIPPSVMRVPGFFKRIAYEVNGMRFSLDGIEHGILRGGRVEGLGVPGKPGRDPRTSYIVRPPEPRIHFALVCASRSCPPLRAYDAERLDDELDSVARSFLNASVGPAQDGAGLKLPAILDWFAEDFGGRKGVLELLRRYLDPGPARRLLQSVPSPAFTYAKFDWSLNDAN